VSIRNLEYFFRAQSIAVIGASEKPRSVGATVLRNLLEARFAGPVLPVNPKYGDLSRKGRGPIDEFKEITKYL
jgi:acetyltransferase